MLIDAAAIVAKSRPDARVLVVGGEPAQVERREGARARGRRVGGRWSSPASSRRRRFPASCRPRDLLVSPRIRGTNTPLKIYSYLRSGKPIVATNLLTHTQVLTPEIARLVDPKPEPFAAAIARADRSPGGARSACRRPPRAVAQEKYSPRVVRAAHGRGVSRGWSMASRPSASRRRDRHRAKELTRLGESPRDRRDRLHRRTSRAASGRPRRRGAGAGAAASRDRFDRSPLPAAGVIAVDGDLMDRGIGARAPPTASRSCITSPRPIAKRGSPTPRIARSTSKARATFSRRAQAAGVRRVVHCSTGGVHGHIANPPANEDAPFNPGDVYQETKLEAETAGARVRRRRRASTSSWPGRSASTGRATRGS